jgi:hypothetical protein
MPGLGRRREEVAAMVPGMVRRLADQPQVGFMYQGGGLKRLPRLFLGQPCGGQLAQFVVDQRQQFLRCLRIAALDRGDKACDMPNDYRSSPR